MFSARSLPGVGGQVGVSARLPGRADDGHQRRAQIVADRVQKRRAQPFGLGGKLGCGQLFGQPQPFQRQGDLVDQRIQKPAVGAGKLAVVGIGDAEDAQPPLARDQRQKEPARGGQRVRPAAGGFALVPGELGGGLVADVQPVFGGKAADDPQLRPARHAEAPPRSAASSRHG